MKIVKMSNWNENKTIIEEQEPGKNIFLGKNDKTRKRHTMTTLTERDCETKWRREENI